MSMNFVNAQFLPQIHADKVSCDGYEATNLMSPNNRGFLAESFIKPPVTITIRFCCNINIERVVISGKVGCQRSAGFEICTTSFRRKSCVLLTNNVEADTVTFNDNTFLRVGRGYDVNRSMYTFVNPRFASEVNISHNSDSLLHPPFKLSHHYSKHLSAVSALAVRVTSTLNGSAVAVGLIEVWGEPASDVPKDIITHLHHLQVRKPTDSGPTLSRANAASIISSHSQNLENIAGLDVPIEFLDAVTHELMSLPVLLPCGQTIDQTTLDRYIKEEAVWGRSPSDPFTGKVFTSLCHPIQNTSLKVRLDEFVLKQDQNLHVQLCIGDHGMLGRGQNNSGQKCSRLVEPDFKRPHIKRDVQSTVLTNQDEGTNKRLKLDPALKSRSETWSSVSTFHSVGFVGCHEDTITTSLDSALRTTLSCLPSFTKKVDKNNSYTASDKPTTGCSTCEAETEDHMYRLKCSHHICRQCLLDVMKSGSKSNCKICNAVVHCHDAVKIHLSRSDFLL